MMLTEATSPDLAAMDAVPCLRDNIDEEDGEVVVTVGVIVVVDNVVVVVVVVVPPLPSS